MTAASRTTAGSTRASSHSSASSRPLSAAVRSKAPLTLTITSRSKPTGAKAPSKPMYQKCVKCHQDRLLSEFYTNDRKCKPCRREMVKRNRLENIDHYRQFDRRRANNPDRIAARKSYATSDRGKEARIRASQAWQFRHPKQWEANRILSRALRLGWVQKTPCFICGATHVEGHHPDYDRPLDVVWLCVKHHKEIHFPPDGKPLRPE